jgi:hypothetical protein
LRIWPKNHFRTRLIIEAAKNITINQITVCIIVVFHFFVLSSSPIEVKIWKPAHIIIITPINAKKPEIYVTQFCITLSALSELHFSLSLTLVSPIFSVPLSALAVFKAIDKVQIAIYTIFLIVFFIN